MPYDFEKFLRELRIVFCICLLGVLIKQALDLPTTAGQYIASQVDIASARVKPILEKVDGTLSNIDSTTATTRKFVDTISADYYDPAADDQGFYWDIKNVLDRSSESSFASARLVANLDAQLNGGKDPVTGAPVQGVLPAATSLLNQAGDLVKTGQGTIGPLEEALEHISGLTAELQTELVNGGNLDLIFSRLAVSVEDFNKLLDNEAIRDTLVNSAKITGSLAGSAETLDIVMRPWRKKASQLKAILSKLAGLLHIALPTPW